MKKLSLLIQLRDFKFPEEQIGKLCFIEKPISVDEGSEEIYVIHEVKNEVVELCVLDEPNNDLIAINFLYKDVFVMGPAYVVNRVTKWK